MGFREEVLPKYWDFLYFLVKQDTSVKVFERITDKKEDVYVNKKVFQ